ncbi:MAG: UDP binding domain-containing protein [Perlucidibaca sp.]
MNLVILGSTPHAWVAAIQMAAFGNEVTLCPSWNLLLSEPDDELLREPGLAALRLEQERAGRLRYAAGIDYTHLETATPDQFWIASEASPQRLLKECEGLLIAALMREACVRLPVFCVLSPFPVGTLARLQGHMRKVADYLRQQARVDQRRVANCQPVVHALPLFVRAGTLLQDFNQPSLVLIGSDDNADASALLDALRPIVRRAREVMIVPLAAAELIKSGVNAMLATRMSFMNEIASLCERIGVDVDLVRQGMAADPRIGGDYLQPGCGFGGPSFSSELLSFARTMRDTLDRDSLIETAISINESQREVLFRKLWRHFQGQLAGRCFAIWGAAYKPGSASVQDSAVHPLLQALWAQGARTRVYDPLAGISLAEHYPDQPLLTVVPTAYAAVQSCDEGGEGADALILVTACEEFHCPDFGLLDASLRQPLIFDGRNIYDPDHLADLGFTYVGIGRGTVV